MRGKIKKKKKKAFLVAWLPLNEIEAVHGQGL
jgi:hypothetical protein